MAGGRVVHGAAVAGVPDDGACPDYTVVAHRAEVGLRHRVDDEWTDDRLVPGDVTLLTRAAQPDWVWSHGVDAAQVHLTHDEIVATCRRVHERDVRDVELRAAVRLEDPAVHDVAVLIAQEAAHGAAGSRLMIDAMLDQLVVHLVRRHVRVHVVESGAAGLTAAQERVVRDYVREHLGESIRLPDLASAVALSRYHFARRFRQSVGTTPHEFVLRQRVARARTLLRRTTVPLLDIAVRCGFADQSHMTREFRRRVGVTPGRYRAGR